MRSRFIIMNSDIFAYSLFFALIRFQSCSSFKRFSKCNESEVVVYHLEFDAQWSKKAFPKQYPEWRPPAQWSKLIGVTHDENYSLYRIGELASKNLKIFAETGKTDYPTNETNVESSIYDEFSSPPVKSGVGKTEVNFFVDGNHSMVSTIVKIIPSPDWFVGIDAFDLCNEGNWIDTVTVEASPIDAGTDSGFTFTAPNWATDPQERIFKITSNYPKHPANSFYYPKLEDLPPIATFRIKKKTLYHEVRISLPDEEEKTMETTQFPNNETLLPTTPVANTEPNLNNEIDLEIPIPSTQTQEKNFHKKRNSSKHRKFCKMSEWSKWSECSTTCGRGFTIRTRHIIKRDKKGRPCPHLKEEKECDGGSDCLKNYFNW